MFNLEKFKKQAFYDGSKALIHNQTRCMQNCFKTQMETLGSAQKAWETCKDEYAKSNENDWSLKYS